jgi:hypothetical protein
VPIRSAGRRSGEEHVAVGEEADEQAVDQIALADDDLPDLLAQPVDEARPLRDLLVDAGDALVHGP